jgi:hypothetical protein
MKLYGCKKKCCIIFVDNNINNNTNNNTNKYINKYTNKYTNNYTNNANENINNTNTYYKKAGMFIYDPINNRILLVKTRSLTFWGPPKGSVEVGESIYDCAFREVFEETGLIIHPNELKLYLYLNNSLYFYVERKMSSIDINSYKNNDVDGFSWIHPDCLMDFVDNKIMILNSAGRTTLKYFMNLISTNSINKKN